MAVQLLLNPSFGNIFFKILLKFKCPTISKLFQLFQKCWRRKLVCGWPYSCCGHVQQDRSERFHDPECFRGVTASFLCLTAVEL